MVEKADKKEQSQGSFYSDKNYRFHDDANDLPLMNQQEINELGKSIREHGQHNDIMLIGSLIIDGRNRYFACRNEGITPRYSYYDSNLETHDYVFIENVLRRHLTPTQKSKAVLKHLKIERGKAKERMAQTQLNGKTRNNKPKLKSSASHPGSLAEEDQKKGRAIDLVAEKFKMSPKTVKKIDQINKIAKKNPFIKKYWERAQSDNKSLEEIYRTIRKTLDIHNSTKECGKDSFTPNTIDNIKKMEELVELAGKDKEIKRLLEEVKKGNLSIDVALEKAEKIIKIKMDITNESVDTFNRQGSEFTQKREIKSIVPSNNKDEENNYKDIKCGSCSLAHLIIEECYHCDTILRCDTCGKPAFNVLCEKCIKDGFYVLRNPNLDLCKDSPEHLLIVKNQIANS